MMPSLGWSMLFSMPECGRVQLHLRIRNSPDALALGDARLLTNGSMWRTGALYRRVRRVVNRSAQLRMKPSEPSYHRSKMKIVLGPDHNLFDKEASRWLRFFSFGPQVFAIPSQALKHSTPSSTQPWQRVTERLPVIPCARWKLPIGQR
jgi:hypothetical protein